MERIQTERMEQLQKLGNELGQNPDIVALDCRERIPCMIGTAKEALGIPIQKDVADIEPPMLQHEYLIVLGAIRDALNLQ